MLWRLLMKKKYKHVYFYILIILLLLLILSTFFVPIVRFSALDKNNVQVAKGVYTFIEYLKQQVFLTTDAYDIFFFDGPVWLSVLGICLNFLIIIFAAITLALCIFEVLTKNNKNINIKQNNLTKKIVLFLGYFILISQIYTVVAFLLTTMLSNSYVSYLPGFECYISLIIATAMIIVGHLLKKDKFEQKDNNKTEMIGFAGSAILTIISVAFIFVPQISSIAISDKNLNLFEFATKANSLIGNTAPYGDFPIGISTYIIFALILCSLFTVIYSIIGFIKASKEKDTTWLSIRLKRWSFVFLIVYSIIYVLDIGGICSITSSLIFEGRFTLLFTSIIGIFLSFAPCIFANIVPLNKKPKLKNKYYKI